VVLVDKRGFYFDEDNNVWRNTRSVAATFVEVTQVVDEDNDVWRIVKSKRNRELEGDGGEMRADRQDQHTRRHARSNAGKCEAQQGMQPKIAAEVTARKDGHFPVLVQSRQRCGPRTWRLILHP